MMGSRRVAYMEDADEESGSVLTGTRVAASVASPTKEKANSKKSRRSGSASPITYGQTDSDSTVLSPHRRDKESRSRPKEKERERMERERERDHEREREHRRSSTKKGVPIRPAAKTSKTAPVVHSQRQPLESEYYGVHATNPSGQRFRSNPNTQYGGGNGGVPITGGNVGRSMSYHGQRPHPPSSNDRFYSHLSTSPYAPPPPPPPPSYPHPHNYGSSYGSSYGGPPSMLPPRQPMPPASPVDSYLDGPGRDHLKQRFQPARPSSALDFRAPRRTPYYDDRDEEDAAPAIPRKPSIKGRKDMRDMQDRVAMPPPPPPRPQSTRPGMLRHHPPPPQTHKSRGYDDESFDGESVLYRDIGSRRSGDFSSSQPRSRRMSMSIAHGGAALQIREPSTGPPARRRPRADSEYDVEEYYDYEYANEANAKVQDQLEKAGAYQSAASGGLALTKDALQKAGRRSQGGSSRSTRSSSSHDESEWRNSATTRTTRSGAGDEDVTIKVTGHAVVEVSGAKIQCQDGSAICISSRPPPSQPRLSDSDKGSIAYDDRRSRGDRLTHRPRAISQSGQFAHARGLYEYHH